jgi:hypothetical protein
MMHKIYSCKKIFVSSLISTINNLKEKCPICQQFIDFNCTTKKIFCLKEGCLKIEYNNIHSVPKYIYYKQAIYTPQEELDLLKILNKLIIKQAIIDSKKIKE